MPNIQADEKISVLDKYVIDHYGKPPRYRGAVLMRLETPTGEQGRQAEVYDSLCGKDIVCITTRCGSANFGDDYPDSNYMACGGRVFDERNEQHLVCSLNNEDDWTFREHYFRAVRDEQYLEALEDERSNMEYMRAEIERLRRKNEKTS